MLVPFVVRTSKVVATEFAAQMPRARHGA
ncbi:MAG: hypothetical protein RIR65_2493, partial [Planctomycetota bacterium]